MKGNSRAKKVRKPGGGRDLRRGAAIGYVVALMVVVAAFSALLLAISSLSTRFAGTYDAYLEQKLVLDEIGDLACDKYLSGAPADYSGYKEQGYTVADSDGTVTVSRGQAIMLTVVFENVGGTDWQLIRYVYGE